MPLPKSVTVAGIKFKIVHDSSKAGEGNFGRLAWDDREIHLSEDISDEDAWATLKHEVIHCATHASGLFYGLKEKQEEALVRMLDHLLIPALEKITLAQHTE